MKFHAELTLTGMEEPLHIDYQPEPSHPKPIEGVEVCLELSDPERDSLGYAWGPDLGTAFQLLMFALADMAVRIQELQKSGYNSNQIFQLLRQQQNSGLN
jgi:hypothetical protein